MEKINLKACFDFLKDENYCLCLKCYACIVAIIIWVLFVMLAILGAWSEKFVKCIIDSASMLNNLITPLVTTIAMIFAAKTFNETRNEYSRLKSEVEKNEVERLRSNLEQYAHRVNLTEMDKWFMDECSYVRYKESEERKKVQEDAFDKAMIKYLMSSEGYSFRLTAEAYIIYRSSLKSLYERKTAVGGLDGYYSWHAGVGVLEGYVGQAIKIYDQHPSDIGCEKEIEAFAKGMYEECNDMKNNYVKLCERLFNVGLEQLSGGEKAPVVTGSNYNDTHEGM